MDRRKVLLGGAAVVATTGAARAQFNEFGRFGGGFSTSQVATVTPPSGPTSLYSYPLASSNANNWSGFNLRQVLTPAIYQNPVAGTTIQISLKFVTVITSGVLDSCFVGYQGAGNAYDFDGNQVRVTFGGSNNASVTSATTLVSDIVNFIFDPTKTLVISAHFSGTAINVARQVLAGATAYYQQSADATATTTPAGVWTATGGNAPTTFDVSNKSSRVTLSNGNLTATIANSGSTYGVARSALSFATGKHYCELTPSFASSFTSIPSLCNASASLDDYPGHGANGLSYFDDGPVILNNASIGSAAAFATGNIIGMATDFDAKLIWFRVGAGSWNNNVSANPATGVGGFSFAALTGPFFAGTALYPNATPPSLTANFGATTFSQTVPSGYTGWISAPTGSELVLAAQVELNATAPPANPGTGLVAATAFLPQTLPAPPTGSTAAGSGFHLAAHSWSALNVAVADYLTRAKNEALFWISTLNGSFHIVDPYDGVVTGPTTGNQDRGKIPYVIGVLLSAGQSSAPLNTAGIGMMTTAVTDYNDVSQNSWPFFTSPMNSAIPLWVGNDGGNMATWLAAMNHYYTFGPPNNWVCYDMNGEWDAHNINSLSAFAGAVTNIENQWSQQLGRAYVNDLPFRVYQDLNGPPDSLSLDVVARFNLALLIYNGYNGASRNAIDDIATTGAYTALLTQEPGGQGATSGRQGDASWIDAWHQLVFEIMAQKFAGTNANLAGQFQRAAMLNFTSLNRWANPDKSGTFFMSKNHFNPTLQIGWQGEYAYRYNMDIAEAAARSYVVRNGGSAVTETAAPCEIGGYAFTLNPNNNNTMTYAFANAGGIGVQMNLTAQTVVADGQFWTAVGICRMGRVGWETRLGPADAGFGISGGGKVSFGPTWNAAGWKRIADNPSTCTGAFTTTFVNPVLVMCRVVWTCGGGISFTQDLTIVPEGILVQTAAAGVTANNWGLTYPVLTVDGTTSPNNFAASTTTTNIGVATAGIVSVAWPSGGDVQYFIDLDPSPSFTSESSVVTQVGNVTPVRAVASALTHAMFVYPFKTGEASAANVKSNLSVTGPNTFTCASPGLGISVVSSNAAGTVYTGATAAGGWGNAITLAGGTVSFNIPCSFVIKHTSGVVTALEVDRLVTATVQSRAPQSLAAYTVANFQVNLLQASTALDTVWVPLNSNSVTVSPNATVAPDGTSTADKIVEAATNGYHQLTQAITVSAGTYTYSCYFKAAERSRVSLDAGDTSNYAANFVGAIYDLSGVTASQNGPSGAGFGYTSSSITSVGSGWYFCKLTFSTTLTGLTFGIYVGTASQFSYVGVPPNGAYAWGARLVPGTVAN